MTFWGGFGDGGGLSSLRAVAGLGWNCLGRWSWNPEVEVVEVALGGWEPPRGRSKEGDPKLSGSGLQSVAVLLVAAGAHGVAPDCIEVLLLFVLSLLITRGLGGASNSLSRLLADTCGGRL